MTDFSSDFRERLRNVLTKAAEGTIEQRMALLDEVTFGIAHLAEFDQETQLLVERMGALLLKHISGGIQGVQSSPEQRVLSRSLDLAKGVHVRAQDLLDSLERPPSEFPGFAAEGEAVGMVTLQEVADLTHDVIEKISRGNDALAFAGLVTECMQEALFGFHAARHGFHGQVLAHCRAIHEDLDLLELFRRDDVSRDLWLSGDSAMIRKKLSPFEVRKKLGRPEKDIPHSFYSELGTHTSVHSVTTRSRVRAGQEGRNPHLQIIVGGSWERDQMLPAYMGLTIQTHGLLLETIGWSQHFEAGFDENWDRLDRTTRQRAAFMQSHVLPWMRERGMPESAIEALSEMNALEDE